MGRAVVTAPVARDLTTESAWKLADPVFIENGTNGTLQGWFCADSDAALLAAQGDAAVTVYTSLMTMPTAIRQRLVWVYRSDVPTTTLAGAVNPSWKRVWDCGASDYFVVRRAGVLVAVLKSQLQAGDVIPQVLRRILYDFWGVADDLGDG